MNFWHLGQMMLRPLGLGRAVESNGIGVWTRLRPDGFAEQPPQLYEDGPNQWNFVGGSEAVFRQTITELADPKSLTITERVVVGRSNARSPCDPAIRKPGVYLVEGVDPQRVAILCNELRQRGLQAGSVGIPRAIERDGSGPAINYDLSLDLRQFGRAMAKVAFNFVCYRFGASVALSPSFDAIRAFARFGEGDLWAFVKPSLLMGGENNAVSSFITGKQHLLMLMRTGSEAGAHQAVFIVIGGKFIGTVDLQPTGDGLPPGTWILSRCDSEKHSWEDMRLPDDAPRAFTNPAAIGMEREFAALRGIYPDAL